MNRLTRLLHRWGSLLIALPLLVVILTGVLLQIKKQVPWVQPPTERGSAESPTLAWNQILEIARRVPEAEVDDWSDIDRLDVRIDRGLVKIQCKNRWEIQVDLGNGAVLASTYRRSDAIEAMHDGSWFGGDPVKLGLFLPAAVVLLGLWLTGLYLFALPIVKRRMNRRKRRQRQPAP